MPRLSIGDVELYYELRGKLDGPTVVFVNGLLTDTTSWTRHLPYFSKKYRCLLYDCRGQGQSDKPDHPYETRQHAADLAALLAALQIDRAHFIGLSNGGATLLHFAGDYPERVRSLLLCAAFVRADTLLQAKLVSWLRAMEAGGSPLRFDVATPWVWGGNFLEENYEALLPFREKGANLPTAPARNLILGAMAHDAQDRLASITAPTLVLVGEDDLLTPPKLSRAIAEQIPGARLQLMEGLGHAAPLEDVEGFSRRVLAFLAEIEGEGATCHS